MYDHRKIVLLTWLIPEYGLIAAVDSKKMPSAALKENALETSPSGPTDAPSSKTQTAHIPASRKPSNPVRTNPLSP